MRKLFFYVFSVALFMSCSQSDEFTNELTVLEEETMKDEISFPEPIEAYGKAVAREIRVTVERLNEMNVDYSKANGSKEFREKFYKEWFDASPSIARTRAAGISVPTVMSPTEFAERYNELTEAQINFIQQIIDECKKSTSYQNLLDRLSDMKEKICSQVSEIEQERLLNVISVLYYGVKEISYLEDQGLMLRIPSNNIQLSRVKTRGENDDFIPASCRKFLATIWTIAVGEPTAAGEIVASVASVTVLVGSTLVFMYEVIVCAAEESEDFDCANEYGICMGNGGKWTERNSGGWGRTMCELCFRYCQKEHVWECPRPIFD
ncbi:hypothetical protein [Bacteroides bouchesdurhonensis]